MESRRNSIAVGARGYGSRVELSEYADRIDHISAGYSRAYDVDRTPEWVLLKLTEEVGELAQAWLTASGQGRDRGLDDQQKEQALAAEWADAIGMLLVFARRTGIDVDRAIADKWLHWESVHGAAGQAR